jgi:formiminotetrahydrofolate cyclodeaminase
LTNLADEDIKAYSTYMSSLQASNSPEREQAKELALREAINVPMDAARCIVRGLKLCQEAAPLCHVGMMAADLGVAASLLAGGLRAMLLTVESNVRQLPVEDPFRKDIDAELATLRLMAQIS